MDDVELKPCPFCGGKVKLRKKECDGTLFKGTYIYRISCSKIYSNNYCLGSSINEWFSDKNKCIELWNKRGDK